MKKRSYVMDILEIVNLTPENANGKQIYMVEGWDSDNSFSAPFLSSEEAENCWNEHKYDRFQWLGITKYVIKKQRNNLQMWAI